MEEEYLKELFKKFIKDSVEIVVTKKEYKSECSYSSSTYVKLLVDGEEVSSAEIQDLAN